MKAKVRISFKNFVYSPDVTNLPKKIRKYHPYAKLIY